MNREHLGQVAVAFQAAEMEANDHQPGAPASSMTVVAERVMWTDSVGDERGCIRQPRVLAKSGVRRDAKNLFQ